MVFQVVPIDLLAAGESCSPLFSYSYLNVQHERISPMWIGIVNFS